MQYVGILATAGSLLPVMGCRRSPQPTSSFVAEAKRALDHCLKDQAPTGHMALNFTDSSIGHAIAARHATQAGTLEFRTFDHGGTRFAVRVWTDHSLHRIYYKPTIRYC